MNASPISLPCHLDFFPCEGALDLLSQLGLLSKKGVCWPEVGTEAGVRNNREASGWEALFQAAG